MSLRIEGWTRSPEDALAQCDYQLALIEDLLCPDEGRGDFTLSEKGATGLAEMLRAIRNTLDDVGTAIGQLFAQSVEATSSKAAPTLSGDARAMLDALFEAAGRNASANVGDAAATPTPAPRLTERRKPAPRRRAA